jgi:hypothetical protein
MRGGQPPGTILLRICAYLPLVYEVAAAAAAAAADKTVVALTLPAANDYHIAAGSTSYG